MSFLEAILKRFGYTKAQTKPNSYPENSLYPENNEDNVRRDLIDHNTTNVEDVAPIPTTAPEQLSGDPRHSLPKVDLSHSQEEVLNLTDPSNPFRQSEPQLTGGPGTHIQDISEQATKPHWQMDLEEVDKENHAIAMIMKKKGILVVDRKMFYDKMKQVQREAALARAFLSDYIEKKLTGI